jgi:nitroreductase
MHDTYHLIKGLRATRAFQERPIETDVLDGILEATRWTGSSRNGQRWTFVVVDGEKLEELASAGKSTDPIRASAVTVALVKTADGNDFDIGRAAQNLMLAADALGVASCPITLHHHEKTRAVLGLEEEEHCTWAIALGYRDDAADTEVRAQRRSRGMAGRRPKSEVVRRL